MLGTPKIIASTHKSRKSPFHFSSGIPSADFDNPEYIVHRHLNTSASNGDQNRNLLNLEEVNLIRKSVYKSRKLEVILVFLIQMLNIKCAYFLGITLSKGRVQKKIKKIMENSIIGGGQQGSFSVLKFFFGSKWPKNKF